MFKALALVTALAIPLAAIATTTTKAGLGTTEAERLEEAIAPYPYISASSRATVYFKMLPGKPGQTPPQLGEGRAYRVDPDDDELLWKTRGWFSWDTHLDRSGRFLVRLEAYMESAEPSAKDIGIAFYDNGKLLRSYSTKEILKDHTLHRQWFLGGHQPFMHWDRPSDFTSAEGDDSGRGLWFALFTSDNYRSVFDVRTGELVRQDLLVEQPDD